MVRKNNPYRKGGGISRLSYEIMKNVQLYGKHLSVAKAMFVSHFESRVNMKKLVQMIMGTQIKTIQHSVPTAAKQILQETHK